MGIRVSIALSKLMNIGPLMVNLRYTTLCVAPKMQVLILVGLFLNTPTLAVGETNIECKKNLEWKCKTETKCISIESVCDGSYDCKNGTDENDICTNAFCKKSNRYLCPKEPRPICSKQENICKNCFRNYHCNEYNCSQDFCANTLGKMACPNENKCISEQFACDGRRCDCHCLSRCECESCNDGYEDSEKFCEEFCKVKDKIACPYLENGKVFAVCSDQCHLPKEIASRSLLVKNDSLWKCQHQEFEQYITTTKVCDGIPQCHHGQDESVLICGTLTIYSVLAITTTFVILSAVAIYMARKTQLIPLKCNKCDKIYRRQVRMRHKSWKLRLEFLTYMLKNNCPELQAAEKRNSLDDIVQITDTYKILHRDNLSDIYFYIVNRVESMFALTNFLDLIKQKHIIMKKLYQMELMIHNNDHKEVVKCLQSKIGACAETDAILDFRNSPSMITKIINFVSLAIHRITCLRIVITFIKVITLTFDIIRDYIILYEMGRAIIKSYDGGSGDYVTTNDYIILFSFVAASFYAHIFIGLYVYHNRYVVLSTCCHDPSKKSEIILIALCTIAFPLLGAATVTVNYLEQYNLDSEFQKIKDTDWCKKMLSKQRFQDILVQKLRMKTLIMAGFPTIKLIESTLESYYQILIVLVLLFKDAYDGVLNQQLIGMMPEEVSVNRLIFFVGTSLLTFIFLAYSIVDFISKLQGDSIGIVGKIILMLIYLIQIFLGLFTLLGSTFSRMDYGDVFPLYLNIAIMAAKTMILILYANFYSDLRESLSSMAVFVLPNTVSPIPFASLRGGGLVKSENAIMNIFRMDELKILWVIAFCEILIRGSLIQTFSSNESLSSLGLSKQYIWIIILFSIGIILIMWKIFFHYAYLFRDILYDQETMNAIKSEAKDLELRSDEENPLHHEKAVLDRPIISKTSSKTTTPFSYLMTFISIIGVIVIVCLCYPSMRAQNNTYRDCGEIARLRLKNGVYSIWKDGQRNHSTKSIFTACEDGKTLIQKTDPDRGNKGLFFQRPRNEYINGFGYTSRDYFIGLDTIASLITVGNNVLTLQAVAHNGTRFEIRFDNVNIEKEILDIDPYFGTQYKNKTIRYGLSYDKPEHGFILVRPNYLKNMETKDEASSYYYFEDYHYAGFTTSDDGEDNVCAHRFKSGWWYPLQYSRTLSEKPFCGHNVLLNAKEDDPDKIDLSTNLNGIYRENEMFNERAIVYCAKLPYSECFHRSKPEGRYNFQAGTLVKLKKTKLFLSKEYI